jgi:hypothetical protein
MLRWCLWTFKLQLRNNELLVGKGDLIYWLKIVTVLKHSNISICKGRKKKGRSACVFVWVLCNGEGNIVAVPKPTLWRFTQGVEVKLQACWTSTLRGGEWSASRSHCFTPRGKNPCYLLGRMLCGAKHCAEENNHLCLGSNPDRWPRSQSLYWWSCPTLRSPRNAYKWKR